MALAVARENEDEKAEHGVTAVPALGLHGRSPAALGEGWEVLLEVCHGFGEDREHLHADASGVTGDRGGGDAGAMNAAAGKDGGTNEEGGGDESHDCGWKNWQSGRVGEWESGRGCGGEEWAGVGEDGCGCG